MVESWAAVALRACLAHLRVSTVTQAANVQIEAAWVDGSDAFCVIYCPPYDPQRRVGLRRQRADAAASQSDQWTFGQMTDGYDLGDPANPDPIAFGRNVADFDIGEPMGASIDHLVFDDSGVGWWGSHDGAPPIRPAG